MLTTRQARITTHHSVPGEPHSVPGPARRRWMKLLAGGIAVVALVPFGAQVAAVPGWGNPFEQRTVDHSPAPLLTSMRDDKVQEALETDEFPTATFTLTGPVDLGSEAADGEAIAVTATGELTIHGVTQPVELAIEAQLVDGTVVLVATTELTFADHDVEVPSSPAVVSVDDHGILEAQILLVR